MFDLSTSFVILFIILVLFVIVLISSIPYSNDENIEPEVSKQRSLDVPEGFNIIGLRPEIFNNCNTFNIKDVKENIGFCIIGKFNDSCLSVYRNDERIHSMIIKDDKNIILGSNFNVFPALIKQSSFKNILIPLENDYSYTIVFDKTENISIKNYISNRNIIFNPVPIKYEINNGFNEYDIHYLANQKFNVKNLEYKLEKKHISNYNKFDEWEFKENGRYTIAIVKNLYNLDIIDKNTGEILKIRKGENSAELYFKELINPNIIIKNLDFVGDRKDINTEYVELINGPMNLYERFMKGKKSKKINYTMMINNKVVIFEN
jgi:hypothetical protein